MIDAIKAVGAYYLGLGDLVYKELQSYACELDPISEEIDSVIRENFISTATGSGLDAYETIVGARRSDLDNEIRRDMLTALFTVNENDFTVEGVKRFFRSLDMDCTIVEYPKFFDLLIIPTQREYTPVEQEYIRKRAADFLPCHLTFTIEFRQSDWSVYDGLDLTFDEWDAMSMTWDELDRYEGDE